MPPDPVPSGGSGEKTREELDSLVITMELTLMSIIQGIALYFLADTFVGVIGMKQFEFLPYVSAGLLIILFFWSRSLIHILTIIRWPLEFIHNFIYIGFTLIESVMFKQIGNVLNWYVLNVFSLLLIWLTFIFDLRMIRRVKEEGGSSQSLLATVEPEQLMNIRVIIPTMVVFSLAGAALVWCFPDLLVSQHGHIALGLLQV